MNKIQRFLISFVFTALFVLTSSWVQADSFEQHEEAIQAALTRGDLDAAESEARLALEESERRYGPNAERTGVSLMWLASVYLAKGQPAEALRAGDLALSICENIYGPDHVETAAILSMLASYQIAAGDITKAETLLRRSVAIKDKEFGPNHPFSAVASSNLANLLAQKGEYSEAGKLYKRSLMAFENAWPPGDSSLPIGYRMNTPTNMDGLAHVYVMQGRYQEAEDLLRNGDKLRASMVGSDHPSRVDGLTILATGYRTQGKHAEGEKALREALRIAEKMTDSENLIVSEVLALLADACVAQGKHDEAKALYKRSVTIDESIHAPRPLRAKHLRAYANVLRVIGRANEATQAEQRAQELQ